ncbi:MAG: lamin tail domain-containing protein [Bacteroidota bacterium]
MKFLKNLVFIPLFLTAMVYGQNNLVITEIMYNPPESGTDSLEFIEIYNNSSSSIDLTGYTMVGVTYTFPAISIASNGFYLLTVDSVKFSKFYGVSAHKWTSGGLNNNQGEGIALKNASGVTVDSVRYGTSGLWSNRANGNGPSLVFCNFNLDNNVGSNWKYSIDYVGKNSAGDSIWASPGELDLSCTTVFSQVFPAKNAINVAITTPISITFDTPIRNIDNSDITDLNISSLLVFKETDASGNNVPFSATISTNKKVVSIVPTSVLTNNQKYYVEFIAGAEDTLNNAFVGVSWSFTTIISGATAANIKITEIMYNPPTTTDTLEFIELYNNESTAVNLAGFHFTRGVVDTLPNYILPAGSFVIIAVDSAKFTKFFNIPALKWTSGSLSNTGESIVIRNQYDMLIDSVTYSSSTPWPSTSNGASICRGPLAGSDAANWSATTVLAGQNQSGTSIYANPGAMCDVTAVETKINSDIKVYPNPSNDVININGNVYSSYYEVRNMLGSIVLSGKLNGSENKIQVSSINNGIYFLTIKNSKGEQLYFEKLIKTN